MDWLTYALTQENSLLIISIIVVVSIFVFAARKAHLNHLDKIKKIEDSFNIK
ncbi:hypothetical protein [Colwellia echini]|uniref:hypothetical protein n=1 Tax=Colwellia echini TaxID=1982103 RepID=UPI001478D273|nr:hypothetical protein [Colwellia echini]